MDTMRDLLVGSTGFVGGNLIKSHGFYGVCHSIDIKGFYGMKPDLCVYAGIPAAMFLANSATFSGLLIVPAAYGISFSFITDNRTRGIYFSTILPLPP